MKKLLNLICMFSLQIVTGQVNLNSSLTACYPLNANANDAVNSLTGTLSAVTPTVDRFNSPNSAYRFAGTAGSYIELPNNPLIKPNAVSFSAWVRFEAMNAGQYVVFTSNNCASFHEGYTVATFFTGGSYRFQAVKSFSTCSGVNQISLTGATVLSALTWYHVGFYIGADSMKLYVNGLLDGALANNNAIVYDPLKTVILGGSGQAFNLPLAGSLDNVRFYNRKLLGFEFNQLYLLDPACIALPIGLPPVVSFSVSGVNLCAGKSISLTDLSSNSPTVWNWQIPGANPPNSTLPNPIITFPNPGNYIVSLVSSNTVGASNTATQTIVVLSNPVITLVANDPTLCQGQSTNLFASGASSYTWSTMQNGPSINVNPMVNTTYTAIGSDNNGCTNTGAVTVNVFPLPNIVITSSHQQICAGSTATLAASGANSYTWNTLQVTPLINVSPVISIGYNVVGADNNTCTNSASYILVVNAIPQITVVSTKSIICRGQNVTLTANGAITYTWSTLQQTVSIVVSPQINTTYTVSGTNLSGCKNNAPITVFVSDCAGLSNEEDKPSFSVFPNPGNGLYELKFRETKSGELEMYNSLSQLLLRTEFENMERTQLDLLDQPNGIYILTLNMDGVISRFKIIKTDQ